MTSPHRRTDIFCKVVDNLGDAGISWRLARELAGAHGLDVTLWIDLLAPLARIEPAVATDAPVQRSRGVTVRHWIEPLPPAAPADLVIEAFGCGLPDAYVAAMAAAPRPPVWLVLEYLSAEPWVDGAHALASPHPRLPLTRRFWFPGFTDRTGGLLREHGLLERRDAFRADAAAQAAQWAARGVPPRTRGETRVSIFCYANRALPGLLDAMAAGDEPVVAVIPEGVAADILGGWAGRSPPRPGEPPLARGRLRLHVIPFVDQDGYDRMLWDCDVNFVRGEDSIVRAQWAARPFVWQIYPQADEVHLGKLAAFLERYCAGLDPAAAAAVRRLSDAWNGAPGACAIGRAWVEFRAACPHLTSYGPAWAARLAQLPELASGIASGLAPGAEVDV
jgi:uncharacterized repeat protein (TIGR03837 family)